MSNKIDPMTPEDFTNLVNRSETIDEIVTATGLTYGSARQKMVRARRKGYNLKPIPYSDKENAHYKAKAEKLKAAKKTAPAEKKTPGITFVKTPPKTTETPQTKPAPKKVPTHQTTATDAVNAYFAGIFDMQGHVELMGSNGRPNAAIRILTTHRPVLEAIEKLYGGEIRSQPQIPGSAPAGGSDRYLLTWPDPESAHHFLEAIAPYVLRYRDQIRALAEWLEFQVLHKYEEIERLAALRAAFPARKE